MVRLYEFQGKRLLEELGVNIPRGAVCNTPEEASAMAKRIAGPVVIKAQTWTTGRFKAGGIKFADTPEECAAKTKELLSTSIKGDVVNSVLVEEKLDLDREFYAGVITDSSYKVKGPVVVFSSQGGVDVEEVARATPERIIRINIDYLEGVDIAALESSISKMDIPESLIEPLSDVVRRLYDLFVKYDARTAEINPLVVSTTGRIYAADCRVTIDDNAVFRHTELKFGVPRDMDRPPTQLERIAWKIEEGDYRGTGYFTQMTVTPQESGYVGFHGIGGGGAMLAADALIRNGLKIANYADTSGDPTAAKVYRVIKTVLAQPGIEGYILMGATFASQEQWHHAHAIVKAFKEEAKIRPGFPVLIVIAGNKEKETHEIIKKGLDGLPLRWELYGRDHIYSTDFVAQRMKTLVEEYRKEKLRAGRC